MCACMRVCVCVCVRVCVCVCVVYVYVCVRMYVCVGVVKDQRECGKKCEKGKLNSVRDVCLCQ